jgi:hypothetical protein
MSAVTFKPGNLAIGQEGEGGDCHAEFGQFEIAGKCPVDRCRADDERR